MPSIRDGRSISQDRRPFPSTDLLPSIKIPGFKNPFKDLSSLGIRYQKDTPQTFLRRPRAVLRRVGERGLAKSLSMSSQSANLQPPLSANPIKKSLSAPESSRLSSQSAKGDVRVEGLPPWSTSIPPGLGRGDTYENTRHQRTASLERETGERETKERDTRERDTRERETRERETRERDTRERETRERETKERDTRERDTREINTREKETKERDARDRETGERDYTCPICLEILYRPRELTCGHAFCLPCLQSFSNTCSTKFSCPSCRQTITLPLNGVSDLPRNLDLEKTCERLRERRNTKARKAKICLKCHSELKIRECGHCSKGWCYLCYPSHAKEVKEEFFHLKKCLQESKERLICKHEEEQTRFTKLEEKIKEAIQLKEEELTSTVQTLREMSQQKVLRLSTEVEKTLNNLLTEQNKEACWNDAWKQYNDLNVLLETVCSASNPRISFDAASLDLSTTQDPIPDPTIGRKHSNNADEDQEDEEDERLLIIPRDHGAIYRKKSSYAKYRWGNNICSRPAGVAVSPWTGHIFVTASDSCKIHIFDPTGKQLSSFGSRGHSEGGFLCPIGITFSLSNKEIYITDKWKHCIHVFDADGRFLRQIGKKGKGLGEFSSPEGIATDRRGRIYVADTCNDRVQILDTDGVFLGEVGLVCSELLGHGRRYTKSEFNEPVGVAVSPNGSKIYVADSGNHRIRVFDGQTGDRVLIFGSRGYSKGQFESPECIAIDEEGFILVGDSGNGRVQIFRPNGRFVRALGTKTKLKGEFGWVSGLAVMKKNEIIVTDFKNNTMAAF